MLLAEFGFESGDLGDAAAVALGAGETGIDVFAHQVESQFGADYGNFS